MKNQHVLIVEDEADIRQLLVMHLSRDGCSTIAVEDGEKGLKLFKENQYDLAVLDWMLPGLSGLDLIKEIRVTNKKLPVLMVTARANPADIIIGLEAGADDYITKPFDLSVLMARVRALLRRAKQTQSKEYISTYKVEGLRVELDQYQVFCCEDEVKLTTSEFKLLTALLENSGRVLSRDKLIELVQGKGIAVIGRTVDTHIFGLRKKLGTCADLIETIRGVGYRVKA